MKGFKRKKSELILDTRFFKVRKDIVELPTKKTIEWIYWDSTDSAMIIGMTEKKKLVMLRRYRYLVGGDIIEFPSGALHKNENAESGAIREFEEESGFRCRSLIKLGAFYETFGHLNRKIHIFFSNNLTKTKQNFDKAEKRDNIRVELVDLDDAIELALKNKIVSMGSSLAVLLLKEKIDSGEIAKP